MRNRSSVSRQSSTTALVTGLLLLNACGSDDSANVTGDAGVFLDAETTGSTDTTEPCPSLFGLPSENTGLDDGVCQTQCTCNADRWEPSNPTADDLANWRAWRPISPWPRTAGNPYESPPPEIEPGLVCAIGFDLERGQYSLTSTPELDVADDLVVTHTGPCGACSSLQDLAVYAGVPDLTTPVRQCGLVGARSGVEAAETCIEDIGFTDACAQIWAFNAMNTLNACLATCFELLSSPYHEEDGSPNACIQCDEDNSGPVFKAVAGRTRRNSGLPTALCRPCDTVSQIRHELPTAP